MEEYNRKRDFSKTSEPKGKSGKSQKQLHYVIQHHLARREHYDLRLEWGGVLLSWAVPKGPSQNPADKRLAIMVEDHPLEYRHFEGEIPQGQYGGGTVTIWDKGFWEPLKDTAKGLEKGILKFLLHGKRLKGKWTLIRTDGKNWLLRKEKDELVPDKIADNHTSKNPFTKAQVQLAKLETSLPQGAGWIYELKYDGYRVLCFLENGKANLISRNSNDLTNQYPQIAKALTDWAGKSAVVLDGEIAAVDGSGQTDFNALQNYKANLKKILLVYIVFDLLALDGEDLRHRPLLDRKEKLKNLMQNAPENLRYSEHMEKFEVKDFQSLCQGGFEGIIAKKSSSVYSGTRNGDWVKLKCENRQEFVIGGYTLTAKKTSGISAILLGYYQGSDLIYAGRAGTGFTQVTGKQLSEKFKTILQSVSPFKGAPPKAGANEKMFWLEPQYIAEIKYAEWTKDNLLRHPSFQGLRFDKEAKDVCRE